MINTLLEHVPIKMEAKDEVIDGDNEHVKDDDDVANTDDEGELDDDDEEEDEDDEDDDDEEDEVLDVEKEVTLLISSDEEAELEAQRIRFPAEKRSRKRSQDSKSSRSTSRNSDTPSHVSKDKENNNRSSSRNSNSSSNISSTSVKDKDQGSSEKNEKEKGEGKKQTTEIEPDAAVVDVVDEPKTQQRISPPLRKENDKNLEILPAATAPLSDGLRQPLRRQSNISVCSVASSIASDCSETESCGNICVYLAQQKLVFNCEFCDLKYGDLESLGKHLHGAHRVFMQQDEDQEKENSPRNLRTKRSSQPPHQWHQPLGIKKEPFQPTAEASATTQTIATQLTPPDALDLDIQSEHSLQSCGNVFILNRRKLFLICGYCESKYANKELFEKHLRQQHDVFDIPPHNEVNVMPKTEIKEEVSIITEMAEKPSNVNVNVEAMVSIPAEISLDISTMEIVPEDNVEVPREADSVTQESAKNNAEVAPAAEEVRQKELVAVSQEVVTVQQYKAPISPNPEKDVTALQDDNFAAEEETAAQQVENNNAPVEVTAAPDCENIAPVEETAVALEEANVQEYENIAPVGEAAVEQYENIAPVGEAAVQQCENIAPIEEPAVALEEANVQEYENIAPVEEAAVQQCENIAPTEEAAVALEEANVQEYENIAPVGESAVEQCENILPDEETEVALEEAKVQEYENIAPAGEAAVQQCENNLHEAEEAVRECQVVAPEDEQAEIQHCVIIHEDQVHEHHLQDSTLSDAVLLADIPDDITATVISSSIQILDTGITIAEIPVVLSEESSAQLSVAEDLIAIASSSNNTVPCLEPLVIEEAEEIVESSPSPKRKTRKRRSSPIEKEEQNNLPVKRPKRNTRKVVELTPESPEDKPVARAITRRRTLNNKKKESNQAVDSNPSTPSQRKLKSQRQTESKNITANQKQSNVAKTPTDKKQQPTGALAKKVKKEKEKHNKDKYKQPRKSVKAKVERDQSPPRLAHVRTFDSQISDRDEEFIEDPVADIMQQIQQESLSEPRRLLPPSTLPGLLQASNDTESSLSPNNMKPHLNDSNSPVDVKPIIYVLGEKHFVCDQCPRSFKKNSRLLEHKRLHTGEKPFACDECSKRFRIRMRLNEHKLRHSKEKRFVCEICNLGCCTKQDLNMHMRHHNNDRRFQCSVCPKAFVRSADLKIHVRVHTGEKPYACDICHKCFRANQNLNVHRKSHMGEASKNYKCDFCEKKFMRNMDRKIHMRTHTGERPFKCEICDRGYSSRFNLKAHIERDHMSGNGEGTPPRGKKKPGPKPKGLKEELEKQRKLIAELQAQLKRQIKTDEVIIPDELPMNDESIMEADETDTIPEGYEIIHSPPLPLNAPSCLDSSFTKTQTKSAHLTLPATIVQKMEKQMAVPSPSSPTSMTQHSMMASPQKQTTTKVVSQQTSLGIQQVSVTVSMQVENVATPTVRPTENENTTSMQITAKSVPTNKAGSVKKERKITSYFTVLNQKAEV